MQNKDELEKRITALKEDLRKLKEENSFPEDPHKYEEEQEKNLQDIQAKWQPMINYRKSLQSAKKNIVNSHRDLKEGPLRVRGIEGELVPIDNIDIDKELRAVEKLIEEQGRAYFEAKKVFNERVSLEIYKKYKNLHQECIRIQQELTNLQQLSQLSATIQSISPVTPEKAQTTVDKKLPSWVTNALEKGLNLAVQLFSQKNEKWLNDFSTTHKLKIEPATNEQKVDFTAQDKPGFKITVEKSALNATWQPQDTETATTIVVALYVQGLAKNPHVTEHKVSSSDPKVEECLKQKLAQALRNEGFSMEKTNINGKPLKDIHLVQTQETKKPPDEDLNPSTLSPS